MQIREKKTEKGGGDFHANDAATFGAEADDVRGPTASGIAFANGFDESGGRKVGNDIGDGRSAEARSAHEVGFGAGTRFAQELQEDLRIGLAQQGRPANGHEFFFHCKGTPFLPRGFDVVPQW
jgi:hypothetical protein